MIEGLAYIFFPPILQTLLLHGNSVTTLRTVPANLPANVSILSLASNEITDLNEVRIPLSLPQTHTEIWCALLQMFTFGRRWHTWPPSANWSSCPSWTTLVWCQPRHSLTSTTGRTWWIGVWASKFWMVLWCPKKKGKYFFVVLLFSIKGMENIHSIFFLSDRRIANVWPELLMS